LLVTPPGATAEALRSVLRSIPEVEVIESVAGCLSAAQAIRSLTPALVVVSDQIPAEEILALIQHPMRERHAPGIVVLSTSHAREQRFLDAGAYAVVTPWDSIERLQIVIHNAAMHKAVDFVEPEPTVRGPSSGEAMLGSRLAGV
jgi:DNA-binding NarL/FixJ family response regulator